MLFIYFATNYLILHFVLIYNRIFTEVGSSELESTSETPEMGLGPSSSSSGLKFQLYIIQHLRLSMKRGVAK